MALEDAINNLAAAINRIADLQGAAPKAEAPKDVVKKAEKVAPTQTAPATQNPAEPETVTESPSKDEEVSTENISDTFFAKANELIQLDVEKAKIVLTELGFAKFKLVPANKHAKGLKLVEAQLNG
jgi:hypothetical protein